MKKAFQPGDISVLFVEFLNQGNLQGILSLFEDTAVIVTSANTFARGKHEISDYFSQMLSHNPEFPTVHHSEPIVNGDIALTSSRVPNAFVTTEIARRQADGSWLWIIDRPDSTEN